MIDIEAELRALGKRIRQETEEWCDSPEGREHSDRLWSRIKEQCMTTTIAQATRRYVYGGGHTAEPLLDPQRQISAAVGYTADELRTTLRRNLTGLPKELDAWLATAAHDEIWQSAHCYAYGSAAGLPLLVVRCVHVPPLSGAWRDEQGVWHHPPITATDNRASS